MESQIIRGDALTELRKLPDESIQNRGRFKKGCHWRPQKPFWKKEWLEHEYLITGRSAGDIAKEFNIGDTAIHFWLKKHQIKTRTISEARKLKKWGSSGPDNPMYGKIGKLNPRWNGGHSPERQSQYARYFWKELAKSILKKDDYKCNKCGVGHTGVNILIVHHIKPWSRFPNLRFKPTNLLTICEKCHKKIHSRKE